MYIVHVCHFAEDYSEAGYFRSLIVWFTRIPVRVDPFQPPRSAKWMIHKQGFD